MPPQPGETDPFKDMKRNFNFAHALFMMHKMALLLPMRKRFGVQTLGIPCALALALMMLWYVATHDNLMLLWIGLWLLCLVKRRIESVKLSSKTHSQYDGWPFDAMKFVKSENVAKMVVEPIIVGILGFMVFKLYQFQGWRPTGLPYFLLSGVVTLPFTEAVKRTIWERKIQGMVDARLEQEVLVEEFHNRSGS